MTTIADLLAQTGPTEESIEDALGVIQTIVQYAGTAAFAISAALLAGRRRMNVVGVVVFGLIVSVGGGTTRDILLGRLPVYWVDEPLSLLVGAGAAALTIPLFETGTMSLIERYDLVRTFDAAGLALFTVLGTNIALDAGAGAVSAVVVGVMAGIGGGILRDSIAGKIPDVLSPGHLYASTAIAGSALNVALLESSLNDSIASSLAIGFIFAARLLSLRYDWHLPRFTISRDDDPTDRERS